jgi:hypothetical protein
MLKVSLRSSSECADGTSVSTLCERSTDTTHENSAFYYFCTEFYLQTPKQIGNRIPQKDVFVVLPQQVAIIIISTCGLAMGTETTTTVPIIPKLSVEPPRSTLITTLHACVKSKFYTLAVRCLINGDTASSVLAKLLGIIDYVDSTYRPSSLTANFKIRD